jgi:hypothetical protein
MLLVTNYTFPKLITMNINFEINTKYEITKYDFRFINESFYGCHLAYIYA